MKYHFLIHRAKKGFWAECLELKGCQTQAASRRALLVNMREVLNAFLDEAPDSDVLFPLPGKNHRGKEILAVEVDPKIAFAFYLRRLRLRRGLSQQAVARLLGYKSVYSYQRLERAATANPELLTIFRLKKIFADFNLEELLAA